MRTKTAALIIAAMVVPSLLLTPPAGAGFPGANGVIAFSRTVKKNTDIWVVDPRSGDKVRLTRTKRAREGMPELNAEGTQIAYSRCGRGQFPTVTSG
jgi:hypothetical protein